MASDRWTDEAEQLVAAQLLSSAAGNPVTLILTALADAGLLAEPGGETREQWAVIDDDGYESCEDRAHAERQRRLYYADRGHVVRRTVVEGPWREVPDGE
jgi:hypothetical protein